MTTARQKNLLRTIERMYVVGHEDRCCSLCPGTVFGTPLRVTVFHPTEHVGCRFSWICSECEQALRETFESTE